MFGFVVILFLFCTHRFRFGSINLPFDRLNGSKIKCRYRILFVNTEINYD